MALAGTHFQNVLTAHNPRGLPVEGIFVVGCPRSGTTLLQTLLAANPLLTTFSESDFFGRHFRKLPGCQVYYAIKNPTGHLCKFLEENGEGPVEAEHLVKCFSKMARFYPPDAMMAAVGFLHLLNTITRSRKAAVWLEKSPVHLWFLPLIEKASERARIPVRVVHIVRDGRDVVASLHKASKYWHEGGYTISQCVRRWNRDIMATLRRVNEKPSDLVVAYEDLVADPDRLIGLVLEQLNIPKDLPRRDHRTVAREIRATSKIIHSRLEGAIEPSSTFDDLLDRRHREGVLKCLNLDALAQLRRTFVLSRSRENPG